jgi:hypothetical protein
MRFKLSTVILVSALLMSGCSLPFVPQRPTAAPIFVTATPIPTEILPATATPAMTAVLGATLAAQAATVQLPTLSTATLTLPARKITLTPSFTPTFTESPLPKGTKASVVSCSVAPQGGFAVIYTQDAALAAQLGCPVSSAVPIQSATLNFQNGAMVWASQLADVPGKVIYTLFNNGTYQRFSDVWTEGVNPETTGETAPAGFNAPVRGFGKIWHENAAVKNALGWATTTEVGTAGTIQRFERGEMIFVASVGQTYIFVAGSNAWRIMPVGF